MALVGATAVGKSAVAQAVAEALGDVELVSVDSMAVYREMEIATAKPDAAARARVRHHLIDLVDPDQEFTVAEYQAAAASALADIAGRGRRALLVGGTGLYLRAVVDRLTLPGRWPEVAAGLWAEVEEPGGPERLYERLRALDPVAAGRLAVSNRRRLVRALEVTLGAGRPFSSFGPGLEAYPPTEFVLLGLPFEASVVDPRIEARFGSWMSAGLLDEVRALAHRPTGLSRTARQALGYKELLAHVEDGAPLEECLAEAVRRTRAFARRQWSWFRRDSRIHWLTEGEDPERALARAIVATGRTPRRPAATGHRRWDNEGVPAHAPRALTLTKHEGAGNDFLVVLDQAGQLTLERDEVRALCDRHRGVGADGVIVVGPGREDADLSMTLFNADGGLAEMSGNGIRCLAQAAVDAGLVAPPHFTAATAAGVKKVTYWPGERPGHARASVEMGPAQLGPEVDPPPDGLRARWVDVGNPHLVLLMAKPEELEPAVLDVGGVGPALSADSPHGVNVEWIAVGPGPDQLALRVFERGVGETLACGTGSCAAAAAAHDWGLVGPMVTVHNPGGPLDVLLPEDPSAPVVLGGPVRKVAEVTVERDTLR